MSPDEIRQFMEQLCLSASHETLPRFRTKSKVTNKLDSGFDPVTEADQEAETVIRNLIVDTYPNHGIIGEEHGSHNDQAEYQWIIDPVDGTRAFISGIPVWGTLIGLYKNGKPLAGVMDQPFTAERFICDGKKATYHHKNHTSDLETSRLTQASQSTMMTTSPRMFVGSEGIAFERLEAKFQLSRYGADCYAFSMVASGQIELVVETGLQLYDVAALIPIIEKSGGIVTDWEGNHNPEGGRVIAAANSAIHATALTILSGA